MANNSENGKYCRFAWIEKPLQRQQDGTIGVADLINTLIGGGLGVLEWRVIRVGDNQFIFVARIGERAKKADRGA